jgi:hypothetical protein
VKPKLIFIHVILLLFAHICLLSCKKKGCTNPDAINYDSKANKDDNSCRFNIDSLLNLRLTFHHFFDNKTFSFDSIYSDDFGNEIQFSRAAFYCGNINYKNNNITNETSDQYILVSANNLNYDYGQISNTEISSIDITIGVDSITNHIDPANYQNNNDLSYQTPSMHWQMGVNSSDWSYLFIVLEGKVDVNGDGTFDSGESFIFHVGGDAFSIKKENLVCNLIETTSQLNYEIQLDANWKSLIDSVDLSNDNFTHTMDNIPLATKIIENADQLITAHQ